MKRSGDASRLGYKSRVLVSQGVDDERSPFLVVLQGALDELITKETLSFKTDSAQSSSNKCKKYLLKTYSYHGNFWNAIENDSLQFISLSDPAIKFSSILEKVNVKPPTNTKKRVFVTKAKRLF